MQFGINVVLFAGVGGACQGLEEAGFPVHIAVNHDEIAIAAHTALNRHTLHLQADIYEVDPLEAVHGHPVNILWASPDCRDHSSAKGGMPRSPRVRSMPWQVCRWAGMLKKRGLGPNVVYLENVREIRGWGPLIAKRDKATGRVVKLNGAVAAPGEHVPVREQALVRDPKRAGRTYRAWVRHIEGLGPIYEDRDLCCADYGVPTTRTRLFGVAHFDGFAPAWPEITHGHRDSDQVKSSALLPHAPAASVIDWSLKFTSIWDRKKALAPATLKRVAVGTKRLVIDAEKPFMIHLTHHGDRAPLDLDDPAPTLTGAHRGELALIAASMIGVSHGDDAKSGKRVYDLLEPARTMTGSNDHAVLAASLADARTQPPHSQAAHGASPQPLDIAAFMVHQRGTGVATSPQSSLRTLATGGGKGGDHIGVGAAFLCEHYSTGGQHQAADAPLNTLSTKDRFTVAATPLTAPPLSPDQMRKARRVADFLRRQGVWSGGNVVTVGPWIIVDIGMRMLKHWEAAAAHELCMPDLIQIRKRDRKGNLVRDESGAPVWIARPLTKTEAMRLIRNSVPRRMAKLLSAANSRHVLSVVAAE